MYTSFVMLTFIYWVDSKPFVKLKVETNLLYKVDNLSLACIPKYEATKASISDIILWKNSNLGWEKLLKVFADISRGYIIQRTVWFNNDFGNRSVVTLAAVAPSITAGLALEIPAEYVKHGDTGAYRCSIGGNLQNTSSKLQDVSSTKFVKFRRDSSGAGPSGFKLSTLVLVLSFGLAIFVISVSILLACCMCAKHEKEADRQSLKNEFDNPEPSSNVDPEDTNLYENERDYTELRKQWSTTEVKISIISNNYEPCEKLKVYENSTAEDDIVEDQIYCYA